MHTHTYAKKGSHRWLVATPLFVLMLALSIRDGLIRRHIPADISSENIIEIGADQTVKTVVAGASVLRMDPGSRVDISDVKLPVLLDGTVLVASRNIAGVHVDTLELQGWNGGFQVTKQGSDITIAALTTPVLVKDGERRTIIPAFMQWQRKDLASMSDGVSAWYRSRAPLALPVAFSEVQLQTMQALESALTVATPLMETSLLPPTLGQELRLEPARDRAESAHRRMRLDTLVQALLHDSSTVDELLDTGDILELFLSPEGQEFMPDLLSLADERGKGGLFLPSFLATPDHLMLAMFHPHIRSHTRVLPVTVGLSEDETFLLLLMTPLSDALPEALADIVVSQWQTAWQDALKMQSVTAAVFTESLPLLKEQIDRLDRLKLAKRVDMYASALLAASVTVQDDLLTDARAVLSDIQLLRDARRGEAQIPDVPVAASSASSSSAQSQEPSVVPAIQVEQTREILSRHGFMETSQTAFAPAVNGVQVKDIVFGAPTGDHTLRFTFDPVLAQVNAIEQNGKIMPYAIPLQQFIDWLRGS